MEGDLVIVDQGHSGAEQKPPHKKKALKKILTVLALFVLLVAGAFALLVEKSKAPGPLDAGDGGLRAAAGMKQFASYEELTSFLEENQGAFLGGAYSGISKETLVSRPDWAVPETASSNVSSGWGAPVQAPSALPSAASDEYSQTNVQVAGVDEGDIVKTDGNYIYATAGGKALILKANPAEETEIVATLELGYNISGLYVRGDKLAVFGSQYDIKPLKEYSLLPGGRNGSYADLRIYDISDRKSPKLEKQYDFEGSYSNSRLIGDELYFVTATSPGWIYQTGARPVPYVMEDGAILPPSPTPQVYYFDFPYTSQNFTSIAAVNLLAPQEDLKSETYVLDGNQNSMYVSQNNLFVTFSKYISEEELVLAVANEFLLPRLSPKEQEMIREIEGSKNYVLSAEEKVSKVMAVYQRYATSLSEEEQKGLEEELKARMEEKYESIASQMQRTVVHKIAVENGTLRYVAQGEVPGRVLNQYAMDEAADGSFRIATTVDRSWSQFEENSGKSYNNLYVLDKDMKQRGALEHIAEGESIYAVRFLGERAYMVTFQRTDPLFVIGLRYPEKPEMLGELKVPGYSTYLHPYQDNLLIGLGRSADENGRETGGIKLSLFDATEVSAPREVDNFAFGDYGSSSSALNDPKGFLFSAEKNLLVIPAVVRKAAAVGSYNSVPEAAGAAVFRVDQSGFELRGYIDHRTESEKAQSYFYGGDAKRSLFIGDNLYSVSDNFLKVNKLENLQEVKSVALPAGESKVYYGWDE